MGDSMGFLGTKSRFRRKGAGGRFPCVSRASREARDARREHDNHLSAARGRVEAARREGSPDDVVEALFDLCHRLWEAFHPEYRRGSKAVARRFGLEGLAVARELLDLLGDGRTLVARWLSDLAFLECDLDDKASAGRRELEVITLMRAEILESPSRSAHRHLCTALYCRALAEGGVGNWQAALDWSEEGIDAARRMLGLCGDDGDDPAEPFDTEHLLFHLEDAAEAAAKLGDTGRALEYRREIVDVRRDLARCGEEEARARLAKALDALGDLEGDLKRYGEAWAHATELLAVRRGLAKGPGDRKGWLRVHQALWSLATIAFCREDFAPILPLIDEAEQIQADLGGAQDDPERLRVWLFGLLRAATFAKLTRRAEALALCDRIGPLATDDRMRAGLMFLRSIIHAQEGEAGLALRDLEQAIRLDDSIAKEARTEPDFGALRSEPAFQSLVGVA